MSAKQALAASGDSEAADSEESDSVVSPDRGVSLQLGGSVYDDAWLAPLVGLYGGHTRGRNHPWQCSLLLLLVNLVIQGMLLVRIGGKGGLLDEAEAAVDMLVSEPGEADITDGICVLYRNKKFDNTTFPQGVPPLEVGEMIFDCNSVDTGYTSYFGWMDLDGDEIWTAEEAASYEPNSGYTVDVPGIHAGMLNSLHKAAHAVNGSARYASSPGLLHQAQTVLDQLARQKNSIPLEVLRTQVLPFDHLCVIGDPLLCPSFYLRGTLDRTKFLEPLRSRGFEGLPLLFAANNWMGSDDVHASMIDICKVALEKVCPALLSAREAQFRTVVKDYCGAPSFNVHPANVSGLSTTVLTALYHEYDVYKNTVLTPMYIGFLALILMFWIFSLLDEFNQLLTWWRVHCGLLGCFPPSEGYVKCEDGALEVRWRVHCGLLCCSLPSEGCVKCEDGALEVISVPRWYAAMALLTNVVPRTVIFFGLTVLGTQFLLAATSFQDLIMNGVALTFLITVDEVMYMAVVPSVRKEWIGMSKPVMPPPQPKFDWVLRHFVNEVFWVAFIVGALVAILYWDYKRPRYGKMELGQATQCLCQGAGRQCVLAHRMGGYPDMPTALDALGS